MTMRKTLLALLIALGVSSIARADEGMWLLEQLSKKYPELVKRGLSMKEYDLYIPNGDLAQGRCRQLRRWLYG